MIFYWRYWFFCTASFIIAVLLRPLCWIGWHRWIYYTVDAAPPYADHIVRSCWHWKCWKRQLWLNMRWHRLPADGFDVPDDEIDDAVEMIIKKDRDKARRNFERSQHGLDIYLVH